MRHVLPYKRVPGDAFRHKPVVKYSVSIIKRSFMDSFGFWPKAVRIIELQVQHVLYIQYLDGAFNLWMYLVLTNAVCLS